MSHPPAPEELSPYPFNDLPVSPVREDDMWSDDEFDSDTDMKSVTGGDQPNMDSINGEDEKDPEPHSSNLNSDRSFTQALKETIEEEWARDDFSMTSPPCGNAPTPGNPGTAEEGEEEDFAEIDCSHPHNENNSGEESWVNAPTPGTPGTPYTPCPSRPQPRSRQIQKDVYSQVLEELVEESDENGEAKSDDDEYSEDHEEETDDDSEEDEEADENDGKGDDVDAEDEDDPHFAPTTPATPFSHVNSALAGPSASSMTAAVSRHPVSRCIPSTPISRSIDDWNQHIESSRSSLRREREQYRRDKQLFSRIREARYEDEEDSLPSTPTSPSVRPPIAVPPRERHHQPGSSTHADSAEERFNVHRSDTPSGSRGPRSRGDTPASGIRFLPPRRDLSGGSSPTKRRSSNPVVTNRRRATVNTSRANYHDVSLPPGSTIVLPSGSGAGPGGVSSVLQEPSSAVDTAALNLALSNLQQGIGSLGVATPTAATCPAPFHPPPVSINITNNVHHGASPAQPAYTPPPVIMDGFDQPMPFNPLHPYAERQGYERVIGDQGMELRVLAHNNPFFPHCTCRACCVRRAIPANTDTAMHLHAARQGHHLILQTLAAGQTTWCIFANRTTGMRVRGQWQTFVSGLPPHAAVILD